MSWVWWLCLVAAVLLIVFGLGMAWWLLTQARGQRGKSKSDPGFK